MAFTEQTRTQLIGLSVAMLGQAPGAKRLQEWINAYNDGMTLEDLAEHIADSEGFKSQYGLSTSEEFAADFLGAVMDGNASGAALGAAEAVVVGALNDGSSQADIALLLVTVLMGLAGDGDNDLYANYGKAAEAFHNKVEVAEHYTLKAKMADPSASVLEGVTDDPATVEAAKRDIDSPPADAVFAEPGAFAIDENASGAETPVAVGMVAATDANGDEVAYRLVNAPDGFAIDAATGAVTYTGGGLDYETTPAVELTVHASSTGANGQPTEVPLKVTVNVGDVQESDAVFADAKLAIDENVAEGMVGKVTATDAEGDAVAYRLAEGSPAGFSIDGATGEVSYKGDDLDHEAAATVDLTVIATSIGANNMATDVSKTFTVSIGDVDDLPDEPMRFVLTPTIDDFQGGDADDTFVAAPVQGADRNFAETLNAFDSIDGGGGADTILVSGEADLDISLAQVSNIEKANIRAPGSISADMSEWAGLESVKIDRFGSADFVTVIVNGASVEINDRLTIGGAATIVGAKGAVDIKAGSGSAVHVGSAGHTETVMVKGGASVKVDNGAGKQSKTVTAVVVDGVLRDAGTKTDAKDADTSKVREAEIPANNIVATDIAARTGATNVEDDLQYVRLNDPRDGITPIAPPTATEKARGDFTTYYISAEALPTGVTLSPGHVLVTSDITKAEGYVAAVSAGTTGAGEEPTLTVNSDAIKMVHLHNTTATVLVNNNSMTADKKPMPEDLELTVNKYGTKAAEGKLCVAGSGSAHNIALMVEGDSWVNLNSNAVKALDVTANAKLDLGVYKFDAKGNQNGASNTLETVKITGAGDVTMAALAGLSKLKTIDASMSEGKSNHFKSTAALAALETVMGGSGKDKVELVSAASGKLAAIHTRGGDDTVKITGAHRTKGLEVKLGDGDDTFEGNNGGNKNSQIDGGDGRDTLKLSAPDATFKDGTATKSVYSNFEILDVGGGAGTYDVGRLGVDTVVARGGTAAGVTLKNMADGMGITVHGDSTKTTTPATITHQLPDPLRRSSGELEVNLLAIGGAKDTKIATKGVVSLNLTADSDVEGITVDSSSTVGGSATKEATMKPGAANYENTLTLSGISQTEVEDITVTGNAGLMIGGILGTNAIDLIDASRNTGGVTFDGSVRTSTTAEYELIGGAGVDKLTGGDGDDEIEGGAGGDTLTGGDGDDEIEGGAGGDTLTGGDGDDMFVIRADSDSQLSFNAAGTMALGVDTITDFKIGGDADKIVLPKSLFDSFQGTIKGGDGSNTVDVNTGTGTGGTTLKKHLEASATKNGFFETETPTSNGFGGTISKHSVAVIREDTDGDTNVDYTWIFIDIDADGDLDLSIDHAIRLTDGLNLATTDFMPSS